MYIRGQMTGRGYARSSGNTLQCTCTYPMEGERYNVHVHFKRSVLAMILPMVRVWVRSMPQNILVPSALFHLSFLIVRAWCTEPEAEAACIDHTCTTCTTHNVAIPVGQGLQSHMYQSLRATTSLQVSNSSTVMF